MWFECSISENVSLLSSFSGKLMLHFWKKFNHFHLKRIEDCKMDSLPLVYPESNQTISTENLSSLLSSQNGAHVLLESSFICLDFIHLPIEQKCLGWHLIL